MLFPPFFLNRNDRVRIYKLFCGDHKWAVWAILFLLKLFNSIVETTQFCCSLKAVINNR